MRFETVQEYMAAQPKETRAHLQRVRQAVKAGLPGAEEVISYQIPAYRLGGRVVLFFAGWKEHFSLYPAGEALLAAFERELADHVVAKGTIRFPWKDGVPVALLTRIAKFRAREASAAAKKKKAAAKTKTKAPAAKKKSAKK